MTMNIDEDPQIAILLFDILWSFIRPGEKTASLILASQAADLIKLADKYDVFGPVHSAYTLMIMQAEDRGYLKTIQSAALAYAANSRDPWLCHYVASRLQMGDPANWQRCTIDHLGFEFWYSLVQAYPRLRIRPRTGNLCGPRRLGRFGGRSFCRNDRCREWSMYGRFATCIEGLHPRSLIWLY
jgi:hypothetical protein